MSKLARLTCEDCGRVIAVTGRHQPHSLRTHKCPHGKVCDGRYTTHPCMDCQAYGAVGHHLVEALWFFIDAREHRNAWDRRNRNKAKAKYHLAKALDALMGAPRRMR